MYAFDYFDYMSLDLTSSMSSLQITFFFVNVSLLYFDFYASTRVQVAFTYICPFYLQITISTFCVAVVKFVSDSP